MIFYKNQCDGQDYVSKNFGFFFEKFETTGKLLLLQIWHDGEDSFTTNAIRRTRFFNKNWCDRQDYFLKNFGFFFEKFETTGKILLMKIQHDGQDSFTTNMMRRARFINKNWREGQYQYKPRIFCRSWQSGPLDLGEVRIISRMWGEPKTFEKNC